MYKYKHLGENERRKFNKLSDEAIKFIVENLKKRSSP